MLAENVQRVQQRIARAAEEAGRDPREITLVAVSKTCSVETMLAAYELGIRHFGENRVEEAAQKIPTINSQITQSPNHLPVPSPIVWHLVGHLQSRKIKDALLLFDVIHSIDTVSLAQKIAQRAAMLQKTMPVLLEVNIAGEATKYGFAPEPRAAFFDAVRTILALPHLDVQGLMTMAPIVAQPDEARPYFRALRELRDELRARFPDRAWQHLSMGMTDDFEAAIAEGATMVRLGRAIFSRA